MDSRRIGVFLRSFRGSIAFFSPGLGDIGRTLHAWSKKAAVTYLRDSVHGAFSNLNATTEHVKAEMWLANPDLQRGCLFGLPECQK